MTVTTLAVPGCGARVSNRVSNMAKVFNKAKAKVFNKAKAKVFNKARSLDSLFINQPFSGAIPSTGQETMEVSVSSKAAGSTRRLAMRAHQAHHEVSPAKQHRVTSASLPPPGSNSRASTSRATGKVSVDPWRLRDSRRSPHRRNRGQRRGASRPSPPEEPCTTAAMELLK